MNHISQDPRLEECLLASQGSSGKLIVITFYFDFRQEQTLANTVKGMLLTIIHSLVVQAPDLVDFLCKACPNWRGVYQDGEWDQSSLESIMLQSLDNIKSRICLFLDGLDEFCGDSEAQLDLARYLKSVALRPSIKLCIASRPHDLITRMFGTGPLLDMHEWNRPGLTKYIFKAFDKMSLPSNPADIPQVHSLTDLMAVLADGVFLWAKFAVEILIDLWVKEKLEISLLLVRLAELPRDVEGLWDNRREQPSEAERALGSVLLRTVCSAARPLYVIELLDMCERQYSDQGFKILGNDSTELTGLVRHLSCGLLELKEDSNQDYWRYQVVLLVHKSVRAYIDIKGLWLAGTESYLIEQMWLDECTRILDEATFARQRSLCYQHRDHDITNPVCKKYGCYKSLPTSAFPKLLYEELHGGIQRTNRSDLIDVGLGLLTNYQGRNLMARMRGLKVGPLSDNRMFNRLTHRRPAF
jgi:hypothetical protein